MSVQTTTEKSISGTITSYIAENILFVDGDLPIGADESFLETGIIDSTGILELQLFVEETFGIDVRDEEVLPENFDSLNKLATYVSRKMRTK